MSMTKSELVKVIIDTESALDEGRETVGFDWDESAARLESAKRALAERFGVAVGFGGILHTIEG